MPQFPFGFWKVPAAAGGLITYVTGSALAAGSTNSNGFTTAASFNASGGNFICGVMTWLDFATTPTITDSNGNSYLYRTTYNTTLSAKERIFYCENATCTNGMTLTISSSGTYPSLVAAAFSNVKTSSAYDGNENGFGLAATNTTVQPGSVTPSANDELLICGINAYVLNETINMTGTGWTKLAQQNSDGSNRTFAALAYKIQTTSGAEDPPWTWTTLAAAVTSQAAFQKA